MAIAEKKTSGTKNYYYKNYIYMYNVIDMALVAFQPLPGDRIVIPDLSVTIHCD